MSQEQSPFHTGELAIQERAGVREQVAGFGSRAIRTFMPDQHREFFSLLSLLLVGSLDADGYPSASVLWGPRLRPFAGTDPPAHRQPAASGRSAGGQSRGWHPPRHPRPGMADPPPQPHEWTGPGAGRKGFHGRRRAILRKLSQVHPGAQPSARLQDRKSRIAGRRTRSTLAVAGLAQRYAVHRQPACRPAQRRRRRLPSGRAAGLSPARRGWPPVVARLCRQPPVQYPRQPAPGSSLRPPVHRFRQWRPAAPARRGRAVLAGFAAIHPLARRRRAPAGVAPRRLALAARPPAAGIRRAPAIPFLPAGES